jgi:site-specific DNA recombinase
MKRAVIYARVSSLDQADNGTSLESQATACQKYAEQNGYSVVETFKESKSGASLDRPLLDRVREMVRIGETDAVIFFALDRLSRDETDMLILAREWKKRGVEMKCATVALEDTPQGQFMLTLLAAVGKLERATIMERTMRGKKTTAKAGKIPGATLTPLGYSYVKGQGRYEIDEAEAATVRLIFDLVGRQGCTLYEVCGKLAEMGVPTKRGSKWWPKTVGGIVHNTVYYGEFYWYQYEMREPKPKPEGPPDDPNKAKAKQDRPRPKREKSSNGRRDPSEWILIKGPAVPAIIDRELWEAAQHTVTRNTIASPRNTKTAYLVRGMLTCEICGFRLGPKNRRGRRVIYECYGKHSNRVIGGVGERCKGRVLRYPEADRKVWEFVEGKLTNRDLLTELLSEPDEAEIRQRERDNDELKRLAEAEVAVGREGDALIDLYTRGRIDLPKFDERQAVLDKKRAGIRAAKAEVEVRQGQREEVVADPETMQQLCEYAEIGLPTFDFEERRKLLEALRFRGQVSPDGMIHVSGIITGTIYDLLTPAQGRAAGGQLGIHSAVYGGASQGAGAQAGVRAGRGRG